MAVVKLWRSAISCITECECWFQYRGAGKEKSETFLTQEETSWSRQLRLHGSRDMVTHHPEEALSQAAVVLLEPCTCLQCCCRSSGCFVHTLLFLYQQGQSVLSNARNTQGPWHFFVFYCLPFHANVQHADMSMQVLPHLFWHSSFRYDWPCFDQGSNTIFTLSSYYSLPLVTALWLWFYFNKDHNRSSTVYICLLLYISGYNLMWSIRLFLHYKLTVSGSARHFIKWSIHPKWDLQMSSIFYRHFYLSRSHLRSHCWAQHLQTWNSGHSTEQLQPAYEQEGPGQDIWASFMLLNCAAGDLKLRLLWKGEGMKTKTNHNNNKYIKEREK